MFAADRRRVHAGHSPPAQALEPMDLHAVCSEVPKRATRQARDGQGLPLVIGGGRQPATSPRRALAERAAARVCATRAAATSL